ncbi:MAG: bacterial transcriptional activator domain-containing protein, partial [Pseudomonadota bacterium]
MKNQQIYNIAAFTSEEFGGLYPILNEFLVKNSAAELLILEAPRPVALSSSALNTLAKRGMGIHPRNHAEFGLSDLSTAFYGLGEALASWVNQIKSNAPEAQIFLVVDMSWSIDANAVAANMENWIKITDGLVEELQISVVSHYRHQYLIDNHLRIALLGHEYLLGPDGLQRNPYWLPYHVLVRGTLRHQLNNWLRTALPSLHGTEQRQSQQAAMYGTLPWMETASDELYLSDTKIYHARWRIRCLGRLRIHLPNERQITWSTGGGASVKVKTLFAFLFQNGSSGAETELICDLLWPDTGQLSVSKNRLHHVVRCLRLSLGQGDQDVGAKALQYENGIYRLVPPAGSWIDLQAFEQFCRQSIVLLEDGMDDMALEHIRAADRLYQGELFSDIPLKYTDFEIDWCWSQRTWLREMYFKLQRDAARILRKKNSYQAALTHCNKALKIDPACEMAHREAMLTYAEQGRYDAVKRQFGIYKQATKRLEVGNISDEFTA